MTTKLIVNRAAVIRSLTSTVDQNADEIAEPLTQKLFPDGVPPDLTVHAFLYALATVAARDYQDLATADLELAKELSDDPAHREERDDAHADLRVTTQRARGAMIAGFGEQVLAQLGLDGELPENADALAQTARAAADRIETAELGEPLMPIDRAIVASQLRAAAARVERSLSDVQREEREAQQARSRRDEADAKLRRVYAGFADVFAGFAYAIGRDDVASRVRPTSRRRAGLPEEEDVVGTDPTPADPTPSDPTV